MQRHEKKKGFHSLSGVFMDFSESRLFNGLRAMMDNTKYFRFLVLPTAMHAEAGASFEAGVFPIDSMVGLSPPSLQKLPFTPGSRRLRS
jgi:hypothetical protein